MKRGGERKYTRQKLRAIGQVARNLLLAGGS